MQNIKLSLLFLILFFFGCQNKNEYEQQTITGDIQVYSDSLNTMSFKGPKDYFVQDGFYTFSSKKFNSKVVLEKLIGDMNSLFSKDELINKYKKELSNVVVESKNDWFVVKGIDSKKNVIIIKGVYSYADRLLSEEENPEGGDKYILLATYAWIIKVEYPQNNSEKMNLISKRIFDSFTINYDNF
jgi:hypothetical protein